MYHKRKDPTQKGVVMKCVGGKVVLDLLDAQGEAFDCIEVSERALSRSWKLELEAGQPAVVVGDGHPAEDPCPEGCDLEVVTPGPAEASSPTDPTPEAVAEVKVCVDSDAGDAFLSNDDHVPYHGDEHVEPAKGFTPPTQPADPRPLQPRPEKHLMIEAKGKETRIKCDCGQAVLFDGAVAGPEFLKKYTDMRLDHLHHNLESDAQGKLHE